MLVVFSNSVIGLNSSTNNNAVLHCHDVNPCCHDSIRRSAFVNSVNSETQRLREAPKLKLSWTHGLADS